MKPLPPSARRHLSAAEGWLELGNANEVNEELEKIPPRLRGHPDVLEIRWQIYAFAHRWEACLDLASAVVKLDPKRRSGWYHVATTLHKLGRMAEAGEVLLAAVDKLGEDSAYFYELARLCCLLHRGEEARAWFGKAFDLVDDTGKKKRPKTLKRLPAPPKAILNSPAPCSNSPSPTITCPICRKSKRHPPLGNRF